MNNSPLNYSSGLLRCCRNTIRRFALTDAEGTALECVHCSAPLRVRGGLWEIGEDPVAAPSSPMYTTANGSAQRVLDLRILSASDVPIGKPEPAE